MSQQLSLMGFDSAPTPTDRLFLAIFPDPHAATSIGRLAQHLCDDHRLRGKPLAADRLHVTLHHLGDYVGLRQDVVDLAVSAATGIESPSFDVVFDRVMSFKRRHNAPLVLCGGDGVAALESFQRDLSNAIRKVGLATKAEQRFKPHVTLLYDDQAVAEHAVEPIGWAAHEFVLVHSLLGQTRHIPLARWKLRR
jgi:RNA 2',3'-cyclic 3'-phosphodiesterase